MVNCVLFFALVAVLLLPPIELSHAQVYNEVTISIPNNLQNSFAACCSSSGPPPSNQPSGVGSPLWCSVSSFIPPSATYLNVSATSQPQLIVREISGGCTPNSGGPVWGSDVYTFDPTINQLTWTSSQNGPC